MKKFYKTVDIAAGENGVGVVLDGRPVRTPAKNVLRLPNETLARAVAAEWDQQVEEIDPTGMRLTRLANSANDRVEPLRDTVIDEISGYAETDLVCYRAGEAPELAARQAAGWDPLVDWMEQRHGVALAVTDSLLPVAQDSAALANARRAVDAHDAFALAGLHMAASATGSVVLALAIADGKIDGEAAWELSLIDETYQIEQWGEDSESAKRRAGLRDDIVAAATFLSLCRETA